MEITAYSKGVRVSTRKVRLVADTIRNKPVTRALTYLAVLDKRGAYPLEKTLRSAIANAVNNNKLSADTLFIKALDIDEATPMKRFHPSTKGRVHPYKKRGTHIRVVLSDKKSEAVISKSETNDKLLNKQNEKGENKENIK